MDLNFTEEQKLIRKSAKDFLSKECPPDTIRELEEGEEGYSEEMWKKMAELGWMGLVIPEKYAGDYGCEGDPDFMDLIVLMEEIGRNVLPAPFLETVVLSAFPILQFGTEEQKNMFLPKVASGDMKMTLALTEFNGGYYASGVKVKAKKEGDEYIIDGTKFFVNFANVADYLIVACRTGEEKEEITLLIVDRKSPGIDVKVIPTTGMERLCRVVFTGVKVPKENVLGKLNKGWEIVEWTLQRAAISKCAEMVGGCEAVLEITNKYAKQRIQYRRPIADFQVIQHYLANMYIKTETSKNITRQAAWMAGQDLLEARELVSEAKAWVSESFKYVCERGVQIHGGIGTTREQEPGLYYRRAWAWDHLFGNVDYHLDIVAKEIGL